MWTRAKNKPRYQHTWWQTYSISKGHSWLHLHAAGFDSHDSHDSSVTENMTTSLLTLSPVNNAWNEVTSSDWQHLLRKVFSDLTSWTGCIFVPGGSRSTWRRPQHKRGEAPQPSLHLLLALQVKNFKWKGCAGWVQRAGKSASSPTPIVFGRLCHEVICRSEGESAWEWATSVLSWNLNSASSSSELKWFHKYLWKQTESR